MWSHDYVCGQLAVIVGTFSINLVPQQGLFANNLDTNRHLFAGIRCVVLLSGLENQTFLIVFRFAVGRDRRVEPGRGALILVVEQNGCWPDSGTARIRFSAYFDFLPMTLLSPGGRGNGAVDIKRAEPGNSAVADRE
jgi:hypothetical protein